MKELLAFVSALAAFSTSAQAGTALLPLNPTTVDSTPRSVDSNQVSAINFVNNIGFDVDLYWINHDGDREFYITIPAGESYTQYTYISHPWLVVKGGSGGTAVEGTGELIAAYTALTVDANDPVTADVANINYYVPPTVSASVGALGTPGEGSTVSGVSVVSGYHCTSTDIDVRIDGISLGKAGAGTTLLGTQGVCGRTNTGYSLLYNFNNLANGLHLVELYANGTLFDKHTFSSFKSGGTAWLSGASKTITVSDFPEVGQSATLEWVQSVQNFVVTDIVSP